MKPRLFIDCDGVLADFNSKIKELYKKGYHDHGENEIWGKLTKDVPNFFYHLDPLPDYIFLISAISKYENDYEIGFLTSMPKPTGNLITAADDKRKWIRKYIHDTWPIHVVMGWENKKYYINSDKDILIDDAKRNIEDWTNHGGIGILHTSVYKTIIELGKVNLTNIF